MGFLFFKAVVAECLEKKVRVHLTDAIYGGGHLNNMRFYGRWGVIDCFRLLGSACSPERETVPTKNDDAHQAQC